LVSAAGHTATLFTIQVPGTLIELSINAVLTITPGDESQQGLFATIITGLLDAGYQMYIGTPNFGLTSEGITSIGISVTTEVLFGTGYYNVTLPSSDLELHFRDRWIQYAISLAYVNSTNVTTAEHMTDNTPYQWQNSLVIRDSLIDAGIYASAYVSARLRYWQDVG
jgi:hypothetical protein